MYSNAKLNLRKFNVVAKGLLLKLIEVSVVKLTNCSSIDRPFSRLNDKSMVSIDSNSAKLDSGISLIELLLKKLLLVK